MFGIKRTLYRIPVVRFRRETRSGWAAIIPLIWLYCSFSSKYPHAVVQLITTPIPIIHTTTHVRIVFSSPASTSFAHIGMDAMLAGSAQMGVVMSRIVRQMAKTMMLGYGLKGMFNILMAFSVQTKQCIQNPKKMLLDCLGMDTFRVSITLAMMSGSFHLTENLLHAARGKQDGLNVAIAGFTSGMCYGLETSSVRRHEIGLLAFSHACKALYHMGENRGWIDRSLNKNGILTIISFMLISAVMMYCVCYEPFQMRWAFYKWGKKYVDQNDLELTRLWTKGPVPGDRVQIDGEWITIKTIQDKERYVAHLKQMYADK